ncbi:MAG: carbon-nitrogen hydrolase family protein, partial [bacterium]|nr:carbon-nitrogen hydrolase family protein [bacterium]
MKIKIALGQVSVSEDIESNVEKGIGFLEKAAEKGAEIICFPEMSFSPFFPQYPADRQYFDLAETIPGPLVERFQKACAQNGIAAVINMYEKDGNGRYFDCSPVIDKKGKLLGKSQMMHIAELPNYNEKYYYWEGTTGYPVYDLGNFKFGIAICYDRHYPEQIRALTLSGAQVVFVPTATSLTELKNIWEVEMQAASVANQIFIAVANHAGQDDKINYFGKSFVTDPKGDILEMAGDSDDELVVIELDTDEIEKTRQILPFLRD